MVINLSITSFALHGAPTKRLALQVDFSILRLLKKLNACNPRATESSEKKLMTLRRGNTRQMTCRLHRREEFKFQSGSYSFPRRILQRLLARGNVLRDTVDLPLSKGTFYTHKRRNGPDTAPRFLAETGICSHFRRIAFNATDCLICITAWWSRHTDRSAAYTRRTFLRTVPEIPRVELAGPSIGHVHPCQGLTSAS